MQDYDVVLKTLLQKSAWLVTGLPIAQWLPTELPKVENLRIDLLGETPDHELVQIEIQSSNEDGMPFRMLEYLVRIARSHEHRIPHQILLYVGREQLAMPDRFEWAAGVARYTLIDMRQLDADPFLESPKPSDNVLGVLARLRDERRAVRRILSVISGLEEHERKFYLGALLILSGLRRGVGPLVEEEAKQMPLNLDIREHEIFGPMYERAMQEGRIEFLRDLVHEKFGSVPKWADEKLSRSSDDDLKRYRMRVLRANTLEELFE